jgi:sigma-B regulation protein RsbU (phosphoserine phosphatase)
MKDTECQNFIDQVSNRLRKLTEANRSLAEIESLDDLLPRLMDLAKEVTAAEASLLFLHDLKNRLLEIVSIKDDRFGGKAGELFKDSVKLKMGEGISGWVAQNRTPVMLEDAQRDPRFSKRADKQRGLTIRTLICVPLVYREELLGVLSALNSSGKPFSTKKISPLWKASQSWRPQPSSARGCWNSA